MQIQIKLTISIQLLHAVQCYSHCANLVLGVYNVATSCVHVVAIILQLLPRPKILTGPHPPRFTGTVYLWGYFRPCLISVTIEVRGWWGHIAALPLWGISRMGGATARKGIGGAAVVR